MDFLVSENISLDSAGSNFEVRNVSVWRDHQMTCIVWITVQHNKRIFAAENDMRIVPAEDALPWF